MNSLGIVLGTVQMKSTDRVPVIPQVFGHAAVCNQVPLHKYLRDGRTLAECQIQAREKYGYDAVFALMDVNVESEAMGSEIAFRDGMYPHITKHVLSEAPGVDGLDVPDPMTDGRMPETLEAIRVARKDVGNEALVASAILGPFTLTCQLLGTERALYMLADDKPKFLEFLRFSEKVAISYGVAQVMAGSHAPIMFDPGATPSVLPPALFREIEGPSLTRVRKALAKAGAAGTWLHIAGGTDKVLPSCRSIGVQIVNFDYDVAPEVAISALPDVCLDGNIKSLSFCSSSPLAVSQGSKKLLKTFENRGGFILSSGCEVPLEANPECITAMVEAARER
ncbi:MAG TPA: uroporphyrinogen decarboxylase family protein [Methanomassiliicoccales archaeon]|jgi:uroporphyrinogen decarboxylase